MTTTRTESKSTDSQTNTETLQLWQVIVNKILETPDEKTSYPVAIAGDQLIIQNVPKELAAQIKTKFQTALSSSNAFYQTLQYRLESQQELKSAFFSSRQSSRMDPIPDAPANEAKVGLDYFLKIFGSRVKLKGGLTCEFKDLFENAQSENNVLISQPILCDSKSDASTAFNEHEKILDELASRFVGIKPSRISLALESSNMPLETKTTSTEEKAEFDARLIQQCLQLSKERDIQTGKITSARVKFDYGRLHQLIYQPLLQEKSSSDELCNLIINKSHFLLYMQRLLRTNVLMHIAGSTAQAMSIDGQIRAIEKPSYFYFFIDESASLEDDFPKIKEQLKNFLTQLKNDAQLKETTIKLVFYSSAHKTAIKVFKASEIENIIKFIDSRHAGDATRTSGTLLEALREMAQQNLTQSYNVFMALLTDGIDNNAELFTQYTKINIENNRNEISRILTQLKANGIPLPEFHLIACGKDIDKDFMTRLKEATYGRHHETGMNSALNSLNERLKMKEYIRHFVKMALGNNPAQQYPIYHNGNPQWIGNRFQLSEHGVRIVIDDVPYTLKKAKPTLTAEVKFENAEEESKVTKPLHRPATARGMFNSRSAVQKPGEEATAKRRLSI